MATIRKGIMRGVYHQIAPLVKSIQIIEVTLGAADTSKTGTLGTTVVKGKSIAIYLGTRTNQDTDGSRFMARGELTNGTTVTVSRNTASTAAETVTVCMAIIEFYAWAIVNIAHGTVVITAGTTNFATPAFTPSVDKDTVCIYNGNTTDKTADSARVSGLYAEIAYGIGLNRVTATAGGTQTYTVGYCLVQFTPGIIKSKNEVLLTINASTVNQDATQAISAVNVSSTIVFHGGGRHTDGFNIEVRGYLNSNVQLKVSADSPYNFANRSVRMVAMEFYPQYMRRMFRGNSNFAGNPTDVAIALGFTAAAQSRLMPNYIGFSITNSFSNKNYIYGTLKVQDASNGLVDRDVASGTATNIPTLSTEFFEMR